MTESTPTVPSRIFISYRREETAYPAGWLFDRLADRFGKGQVFKDVDSIQLGDDFGEVIATAVGSCDVLLALIGDRWLTITDEHGRRRLDNPDDFVRLEIEAALTRDIRVIPILVEGARIPRADQLPPSLTNLARRQALELSPSRFDFDTSRLLRVLDRTLTEVPVPPATTDPDVRTEQDADTHRGRVSTEALQDAASTRTPTAEPSDLNRTDVQETPEDREHPSLGRPPNCPPVGSPPRARPTLGKEKVRVFKRVWYCDQPPEPNLYGTRHSTGRLLIAADHLLYEPMDLMISGQDILQVQFGKAGTDPFNLWISVTHRARTGPSTEYFASGRVMGWAGMLGINRSILSAIKELQTRTSGRK